MKQHDQPIEGFPIEDPKTKKIYQEVKNCAIHGQNCLLYGPTGSGKEFLARYYHEEYKKSHHTKAKFVSYNCVGTTSEMGTSIMFGHKKGAFTNASFEKIGLFRDAENGVLFLDEIGHLPDDIQAILLRAIDPGEATQLGANEHYSTKNVIVIGATDKPPDKLLPQLLFRLGQVIEVPCLDDRPGDIPGAVALFVRNFLSENKNLKKSTVHLKDEIIKTIIPFVNGRTWPGNFRLLNNVIRFAIIHADVDSGSGFLTSLKKHFVEQAEKGNADRKAIKVNPAIKLAIDNLDVTWKQEEKDRWVNVLTEFGNKPFMRRDINNIFSFDVRTAQDRIKILRKAKIIEYYRDRTDRFIVASSKAKEQIPSKEKTGETLFHLPETNVELQDRKAEIDDVVSCLTKTDHIFLSGESRSGKTTLALLTGNVLKNNRDVYYHELQENGMELFLQQLTKFLISKGFTQIREFPLFRPFMLHSDAAVLTGYVDQYFNTKNKPVFILDNLHKLKSREDLNTLQIILKYWKPLKFIFTGDKLSNELIFGEGISIVEYLIASNKTST